MVVYHRSPHDLAFPPNGSPKCTHQEQICDACCHLANTIEVVDEISFANELCRLLPNPNYFGPWFIIFESFVCVTILFSESLFSLIINTSSELEVARRDAALCRSTLTSLTYLLTLLCILWSDTTFHETLLEYTRLTANEALSDVDDEDDLRGWTRVGTRSLTCPRSTNSLTWASLTDDDIVNRWQSDWRVRNLSDVLYVFRSRDTADRDNRKYCEPSNRSVVAAVDREQTRFILHGTRG